MTEKKNCTWEALLSVGSSASLICVFAPLGSRSIAQEKCIRARWVLFSLLCT